MDKKGCSGRESLNHKSNQGGHCCAHYKSDFYLKVAQRKMLLKTTISSFYSLVEATYSKRQSKHVEEGVLVRKGQHFHC